MASSLAKEAGDTSAAGSHGAYSNRENGENKHSNGKPSTENRVFLKEPIHHRCG